MTDCDNDYDNDDEYQDYDYNDYYVHDDEDYCYYITRCTGLQIHVFANSLKCITPQN